ncbi:pyrroline-5-carboxylate reductase [Herbiconiux sp. L3-i23]|uniref:pyrroline-5-carboxylate reductase n=1 Tax=Herbiconiux sp. L3-i23 TaxID=2905871 RepID=UPI00205C8A29|nr:pyrroline-5-carboxylate reductase [Herbiconiux sp. L3-i23]BDI21334.1 pyrroline-5-carboxylate reductase [Herbiconiux sp. L3-i23]
MQDQRPDSLPRIALLGAGSMGRAILAGLLAPGVTADSIAVTTRSARSAAELPSRGGLSVASVDHAPDANRIAASEADVVILAVKPAGVLALAADIASAVREGAIVVSVAAGVPTAALEEVLPGTAVVRAMPNTPATVGLGVTGLSAGAAADAKALDLVARVFATVGTVHRVPEAQLDALTAISGSGPAYVFYLVEKLAAAGSTLGLDPELSTALAAETFRGAAELLVQSGEAPEVLRAKVTSPNGTTEKAIAVFDANDVPQILEAAAEAARRRSAELAAQYGTRPR